MTPPINGVAIGDTTLDMPLEAYLAVAVDLGFEEVMRLPFARLQSLHVRGRPESLGEVQETLCVMARKDGFLVVLESYTRAGGPALVNMAELYYRFHQGPHHETAAEFGSLKIRLTEELEEDERVYQAVVAGLGGSAPMDDGAMCVSAMEDARLGLRAIMGRKDAYSRLPADRRLRIGEFLPEWPAGFLHTYGFTLARACETDVARHSDAPSRMAESRRLTEERLRLLPHWARRMLGCDEEVDQRAA